MNWAAYRVGPTFQWGENPFQIGRAAGSNFAVGVQAGEDWSIKVILLQLFHRIEADFVHDRVRAAVEDLVQLHVVETARASISKRKKVRLEVWNRYRVAFSLVKLNFKRQMKVFKNSFPLNVGF